jgi:hypothetical protein
MTPHTSSEELAIQTARELGWSGTIHIIGTTDGSLLHQVNIVYLPKPRTPEPAPSSQE